MCWRLSSPDTRLIDRICRLPYIDLNGHEASSGNWDKMPGRRIFLKIDDNKPFLFVLLAKIDPFNAAGMATHLQEPDISDSGISPTLL